MQRGGNGDKADFSPLVRIGNPVEAFEDSPGSDCHHTWIDVRFGRSELRDSFEPRMGCSLLTGLNCVLRNIDHEDVDWRLRGSNLFRQLNIG